MGNTRCYHQEDGEQLWADYYCRGKRTTASTPLMVHSHQLTDDYNFNCYGKAALSYYTLMNFLGVDLFKKCLREYINRWRNKHALPWDYFNTFNDVSKQDLSWFWDNWYYEFNYFDMAIKNVKATGNNYSITVENIGGKATPVNLTIVFTDSSTETLSARCDVWKSKSTATFTKIFSKKIKQVKLTHGIYPDADEGNDVFEVK